MVCSMGYDMIKAHRGHACLSRFITTHKSWKVCLVSLNWREKVVIKAPQKEFRQIYIITTFLWHGPLLFSTNHLFCLSYRKTRTIHVGGLCRPYNMFLGTSTYIVIMTFFLVVNRSGLGTSSTSNQRSSKALGRLHGPWCKQPHNDPWLITKH